MNDRQKIKKNLSIALFAALMAVGAFIKIPVGPVPISLTSFFMILAALLLGERDAFLSVIIYLIAGIVGLPVFAGGSGPAVFAGPTGGFLIGYLPAAFVTGLISINKKNNSLAKFPITDVIAATFGTLILYLVGVPWLKWRLGLSWDTAFSVGMLPFLPGDILKAVSAVLIKNFLIRQNEDFLPIR